MTLLAACVGASSLAVSIPGWAQNNGEEETLTVTADGSSAHGEGYVAKQSKTGSRTNGSVLATPQSLSVIGRDELTDRNVQTTTEALRYTPGVFASTSAVSSRFDYFSLRGFDATLNGALLDGAALHHRAILCALPALWIGKYRRAARPNRISLRRRLAGGRGEWHQQAPDRAAAARGGCSVGQSRQISGAV
ncbi:hypothetical protein ACVW2B_004259 [Ewingella americana]